MFTGIIEELGEVAALTRMGDAARLRVRGPRVCSDVRHGDSIAVNGVCLTAVDADGQGFSADIMAETLARTGLGQLVVGDRVNLERPVSVAGRLGGHIVQGHVDGLGVVVSRAPSERWEVVTVAVPTELGKYLVAKGSVTIDGVSLTVVDVADSPIQTTFTVSLIPTTLSETTLGSRAVGERVNIEVDVLAKYVERLMGRS